jgi:hypothetical protein
MSTDDTQIEKKTEVEESNNSQNIEKKEEQKKENKEESKEDKKEELSDQKIHKGLDQLDNMEYELLKDDNQEYDLSFKVIVIGDSGIL